MRRDRVVRGQRRSQYQADLVLLQQVAGAVSAAGFWSAVGHELKAERCAVVVAGLLRVAHIELDEVGSVNRKGVSWGLGRCQYVGLHESSGHSSNRQSS
jgi:hypothetical protein